MKQHKFDDVSLGERPGGGGASEETEVSKGNGEDKERTAGMSTLMFTPGVTEEMRRRQREREW